MARRPSQSWLKVRAKSEAVAQATWSTVQCTKVLHPTADRVLGRSSRKHEQRMRNMQQRAMHLYNESGTR